MPRLIVTLALLSLLLTQLGCPGHEARVENALAAIDRGDLAQATAELTLEMGVESNEQLPADLDGDNALLLLDRATILQSMDSYEKSQRDYGAADKSIDVLDLSRNAAHDIGKYLFSDDVGPYKAPAFEKLLLNSFNMINYLARGDLNGARVEAKRLEVMERYLKEHGGTTKLVGLGSYLAGFTYEKSGRRDPALNHYEEALSSKSYTSLRDPLRTLAGNSKKRKRIAALVGDSEPLENLAESGEGELLVVVGYGRVPPKVPHRIPIGLALTIASPALSPHDRSTANELAANGLVTWVNFPTLGKSRGRYDIPSLWVDGRRSQLEHVMDIEAEVRREWKENEPTVIVAAITRLIARAVAGQLVKHGSEAAGAGGIGSIIAGLAVTATMAVMDTPDTRSWVTLPANVAVARMRLKPGRHRVKLSARGITKEYHVNVRINGWTAVAMTALR